MPLIQYTGPRSPAQNPQKFIKKLREKYSNISDYDIQVFFTRAVMLSQPPTGSRALLGTDILSDDVQSLPWWRFLGPSYRRLILSHPIDSGLNLAGSAQVNAAIRRQGESREGLSRRSLVSIPGLENTYVWCKLNEWTTEVSPRDLSLIRSHTNGKMGVFNRSIREVDIHGPYAYVRPYGDARVREQFRARTVEDINDIFRDQSRKDLFHGFDPIKE